MGMDERGLGVDLLEELLAGHRRREHAERALGGACGKNGRAARKNARTRACGARASLALHECQATLARAFRAAFVSLAPAKTGTQSGPRLSFLYRARTRPWLSRA